MNAEIKGLIERARETAKWQEKTFDPNTAELLRDLADALQAEASGVPEELVRLSEAATPSPVEVSFEEPSSRPTICPGHLIMHYSVGNVPMAWACSAEDAAFIAAATDFVRQQIERKP